MNINPKAITVLCFGDSNTYGTMPDRHGRFAADARWPGVLQKNLGDDHYIIEDGVGGRTTDLEHPNPKKPSRNGLTYFRACVDGHMPLDFIIIMLGTNDLKTVYNRSAQEVAAALKQYPEYVSDYCAFRNAKKPKIIIVSPAYMDENASKFIESMPTPGIYDAASAQKSRQFKESFQQIAQQTGCMFLDAGPITKTGDDGCHLNKESHQKLAEALLPLVRS